jgi:isoprenylcysteine carboxyl methyltransferase (ICMT) family protein YpbQ
MQDETCYSLAAYSPRILPTAAFLNYAIRQRQEKLLISKGKQHFGARNHLDIMIFESIIILIG